MSSTSDHPFSVNAPPFKLNFQGSSSSASQSEDTSHEQADEKTISQHQAQQRSAHLQLNQSATSETTPINPVIPDRIARQDPAHPDLLDHAHGSLGTQGSFGVVPSPSESPAPSKDSTDTTSDQSDTLSWQEGVGKIEFGFDSVMANNRAMREAAREFSETKMPGEGNQEGVVEENLAQTNTRLIGALQIQAAWEVDGFRWPRLAKRFLTSHYELFDNMAISLLRDLQPTRSRIGICSTRRGEGKSTIAVCLARWAAQNLMRCLLVDGDVENPMLTVMSGLETDFCWKEGAENDFPLSEMMIRSAETGLVMMPGGPNSRYEIHEKSLATLASLMFQLKYEFDVVFIDMGTLDNVCVHGNREMDLIDKALLVRDPRHTTPGELDDSKKILGNLGIKKVAVVENFGREPGSKSQK